MKRNILFFLLFCCPSVCIAGEEEDISLISENRMGRRGAPVSAAVQWETDSPWFGKNAPVCRAVRKPMPLEPFRRLVEEYEIPEWDDWKDPFAGKPEDDAIYHSAGPGRYLFLMANAEGRRFRIGLANSDQVERDEHMIPIVRPLPTKEEAVAICREWFPKLGLSEDEFYRGGTWPGGFEVVGRVHRISGHHPVTKERVVSETSLSLRFAQQIGGLPAFWNGFAGNVMFEIADGGEFCSASGCLRAWEKIGDYEILDRGDIAAAIGEGFFWATDPIDCETLTITKITLEAFHTRYDEPQKDFPLLWCLTCRIDGGTFDGQTIHINIPALKQHRDKYGPPPAPGAGPNPK